MLLGVGGKIVKLVAPAQVLLMVKRHSAPYFLCSRGNMDRMLWTVSAQIGEDPVDPIIEGRTVTVVHSNLPSLAKAAMRVIRHLLRLSLSNEPWLFLHASMVVIEGKGMVIAGNSRAGKTTLMLGLAGCHNAEIVSNDDLSIDLTGTSPTGVGWPRAIRIRTTTLETLGSTIFKTGSQVNLSHPEQIERNFPQKTIKSEAVLVEPLEMAAALGANIRSKAKVDCIVFPEKSSTNGPAKIDSIESLSERRSTFSRFCHPWISVPGTEHAPELAALFSEPRVEDIDYLIGSRFNNVQFYRLESDFSDAHTTVDKLAKLVS